MQCERVDGGREPWRQAQRFQLGRERNAVGCFGDEQWLLTEPVASNPQRAFLAVPDGKHEHAMQFGNAWRNAPCFECREHHGGVRGTGDRRAHWLELGPKAPKIVDFSVENDGVSSAGGVHGLRPGRRQVDDGQAPMSEGHTTLLVLPQAIGIRATMPDGVGHRTYGLGEGFGLLSVAQNASDTTHRDRIEGARDRARKAATV